ncbi:copper chaperone PCu(A)C [Variovorax terrae]|uniref:Copper chaperone PCu(A)C n=1 Tax=Variovorax terrae TaxID=2923278 RepID=A0A9X2APA7_9BURK|nr:copper chaperone PCu(A)C [Variovorax terrae]MCJ0764675.1 copper chaperone PCu(A)C [Variovorax terrae]
MKSTSLLAGLALGFGLIAGAVAQPAATGITVDGAWARASVQGQKASGAFMKLTSKEATRLVAVSTPVAGVAEVHEMKMEGDVMKMRALPGLDLPAGQTVELKPGGYHVMLMDLKAPLAKGTSVPLTLTFKDAKGADSKLEIQVPVATAAPGAMPGMGGGMAGHKH